jgi:hypothetical protein
LSLSDFASGEWVLMLRHALLGKSKVAQAHIPAKFYERSCARAVLFAGSFPGLRRTPFCRKLYRKKPL